MLDIRFERISMGINEKKTLNPTLKMVEMALRNVGFSEGVWLLKSPHRTRKKGAERFRAVRFDGAGIRIRCKPGGNETCYEWTLFPPAGTDQDLLFSDLCSLHPKDLRLVRSSTSVRSDAAVFGGLMKHLTEDRKPELEVLHSEEKPEEAEQICFSEDSGDDELEREFEETQDAGPGQTQMEASEVFGKKMPTISSLDISGMESGRLRSDPVLDRALIALGIALKGEDSIPRGVSSEVMVRLLNIGGLLERSVVYDSVKGAMKAIMMSLSRRGYIDRVMGKRNSSGGQWVKGYRITNKGRKRLDMLAQMLEPSIAEGLVGAREFPMEAEKEEISEVAKEKTPSFSGREDQRIGAIKGLIGEYESVKKQMDELGEMIKELEGEKEDGDLLVSGLKKALEEKFGEREAINAEIARFEAKIKELSGKAAKAESDIGELRKEMGALAEKRSGLEAGIFGARSASY